MTPSDAQPLSWLPKGITEDDVIDLVDGQLPKDREQVILAAIKAEPRLGALVKQLREDRTLFEGSSDLKAPPGLALAIEAKLEAAAMRDLASAESAIEQPIPVSSIEPVEPGILRLLMESAWPRRLAMAASVAIVVGIGALGLREAVRSGAIAWPDAPKVAVRPPVVNPDVPANPEQPAPVEIAANPNNPSVAEVNPAPAPEARPTMTLAKAVELAREGRLVLTIRAVNAQPAIARLDTLARTAGREGGWQGLDVNALPAQYAALRAPSLEVPGLRPLPTEPVVIAADAQPNAPLVGPRPAHTPVAVVKAIYAVELDVRERTLESLLASITDGMDGSVLAAFREAPPMPEPEIALDPEHVLWWTTSPAAWVKKHAVPIVIETVE